MALVDNNTLIALAVIYVGLRVWNALGGWPQAFYRITRQKHFIQDIIEADQSVSTKVHKWKKIQQGPTPWFEYRGVQWFTGGPDATGRVRNAPAWVYNHRDARALPLEHGKPPMDPMAIHQAFANKSIGDLNRLGLKRSKVTTGGLGLIMVILVILTFLAMYYSYNTACALHSPVCL